MSPEANEPWPDLIRWTFTVTPGHRQAIETHLENLGADVWVREGNKFQVTWEEPGEGLEEVIEALWALHGEPFEVTHEEFDRSAMYVLEHSDDEDDREAA